MDIGVLEQKVMLAILRKRPKAYGVEIQREIEARTAELPSIGAIYAALDRLAQKGYVKSELGEPTSERGGRAKLYYDLTGLGQSSLESSLVSIDSLRRGLRFKEARA
jgi:PadR family transcriptional regulator PadR